MAGIWEKMTAICFFCFYYFIFFGFGFPADDLVEACKLCKQLGLSLRTRSFPSGLVVLQTATHSDAEVSAHPATLIPKFLVCVCVSRYISPHDFAQVVERVKGLLQTVPSLTAASYSKLTKLSLTLALDQLLVLDFLSPNLFTL